MQIVSIAEAVSSAFGTPYIYRKYQPICIDIFLDGLYNKYHHSAIDSNKYINKKIKIIVDMRN